MDETEARWLPIGEGPAYIKEEPSESSNPSLSPNDTPSASSATNLLPSTWCRHSNSTTSLATTTKRVRPYPSIKRGIPLRTEDHMMTNTPGYGTWSLHGTRSGSNRPHPTLQRQSSNNDDTPYSLGQQFMPDTFISHIHGPSDPRSEPSSSNLTSSLTGAMGESTLSPHSRQSRSPPSRAEASYPTDWSSNMQMNSQIPLANSAFPGVASLENMTFPGIMQDLSSTNVQFNDFDPSMNRDASPDSISSGSSVFNQSMYTDQYTVPQSRGQSSTQPRSSSGYRIGSIPSLSYRDSLEHSSSTEHLQAEVIRLRRRTHELEVECAQSRLALDSMRGSQSSGFGLLTPRQTPPQSSTFMNSWKARTEARKRMFCSLNRAGNALCAWHDSRRERRTFPPRNAPPGYLNCGCTYEEALFEESLSRHNVGSYHPGETVRMDPALRNPLLKLLQQRYGYQDGDFERDPITGEWVADEGHTYWEQQAHSGASARRRVDAERH